MITLIQIRSGELHLVDYMSNDGTRHRTKCGKIYTTSQLINTLDLDSPIAVVCQRCYEVAEENLVYDRNKYPQSAKGELYEHLCRNYKHIQMKARDTETFYSPITNDRFVQAVCNYQKLLEKHKSHKLWKWYAR